MQGGQCHFLCLHVWIMGYDRHMSSKCLVFQMKGIVFQSKYLQSAHCGKSPASVFQEFFASIDKIFILGGSLGTGL